MKLIMSFFILVFILISSVSVYAQTSSDIANVSDSYVQAISSGDDALILATWQEVRKTAGAEKYLLDTYPLAAHAYRLTEKVVELSKVLEQYQKIYPQGPVIKVGDILSVGPAQVQGVQTNRDKALNNANQDLPSNSDQAQRAQNAVFKDNGQLVATSPNQDQPSNQEILANQLRRGSN